MKILKYFSFIVAAIAALTFRGSFAGEKLIVTPDRADHRYIVGEEAEFTLVAPTSCTTGVIQEIGRAHV